MVGKFFVFLRNLTACTTLLVSTAFSTAPQKDWNWMVYMCNDNNLHRYGIQNFQEMTAAGSTDSVNVLLQMDDLGKKSIKRFYIEQDNPIVIESQSDTESSFSGTPQNLFEFAHWAITNYASKHTCLVLWNHGSGIKDPNIWDRMIMRWRDDLFVPSEETGLLKLNRTFRQKRGLARSLASQHKEQEPDFNYKNRGIAFNDAAETYLKNGDLKESLSRICTEALGGNKIDIVAMDACHMAMIEVASEIKDSVKTIIGSEEVEPGAGYNYALLNAFATQSFNGKELAQHIVKSYEDRYKNVLEDFTQSAIDLDQINSLEACMTKLSSSLVNLLKEQNGINFRAVRQIRTNSRFCTEFLDPDYVDLSHLLKSFVLKGSFFLTEMSNQASPQPSEWATIVETSLDALTILESMIIANTSGSNLPDAHGLAIYFPMASIHPSYYKTEFAKTTGWTEFLEAFAQARKNFINRKNESSLTKSAKPCCQKCKEGKECEGDKHKHEEPKKKQKKERPCLPCSKRRKSQQAKKNFVVASVNSALKNKSSKHKSWAPAVKQKPCCKECGKHAKENPTKPCAPCSQKK